MKRPAAITLNRSLLEQLAGVEFSDEDFSGLVDATTTIANKFRTPIPDFMLDGAWVKNWHRQPRQIEMEVRRAFVEEVEGIWKTYTRSPTRGSFYVSGKKYTGPLNLLLQELLIAAGYKRAGLAANVHHDIEFLHTGKERDR